MSIQDSWKSLSGKSLGGLSCAAFLASPLLLSRPAVADPVWTGYAGDAQHTAQSSIASQPIDQLHWKTPVDLNPVFNGNDLLIHYGSPLITAANTVIVPVKTGTSDGFQIEAFNGGNGSSKWTLPTAYTLPPHDWVPSYSPALTPGGALYFPGPGGTVQRVDSPDSNAASASAPIAFYGTANYNSNPSAYNPVQICTPLTSDSAGDIYFGFSVNGSAPGGLTSGIAKITPAGSGSFISAGSISGAANQIPQNCAPAITSDGKTLYVAVSDGGSGSLVALNTATMTPVLRSGVPEVIPLVDPHTGNAAIVHNDSTSSPLIGPDGDVYYGILENPFYSNHLRGYMLHFSSDLSQTKTPGAFGWDNTASIVPKSMVPGYVTASPYLIMTKYNNYVEGGGDGNNKVAILDPNLTQVDPITGATVMKEVETLSGPVKDSRFDPATYPNAVREWCINTAVVDPATDSILINSEDGNLYRWDLATDLITQTFNLTDGVGEAYTPTLIGQDGTVYAINNATLFAVGVPEPATGTLVLGGVLLIGVRRPRRGVKNCA